MKGSYRDNPQLNVMVFNLLDLVFRGIGRHAADVAALFELAGARRVDVGATLDGCPSEPTEHSSSVASETTHSLAADPGEGARWEDVSTPFVETKNGNVIAHVGVIEIPMVITGRETTVASIHAVATDPRRRREGLFRTLMDEAMAFCDSRYQTQILTTEHPEYFEPFGFRHVQEHRFRCSLDHELRTGTDSLEERDGFRLLDVNEEGDIASLLTLLVGRTPVSSVVGVMRERAIFIFNEIHRPMYYLPELNAILCATVEGRTLFLYDIVGCEIPTLRTILERFPHAIEEVLIHFSPDRLGDSAEAEPYLLDHDGPSYLMVRGQLTAETEAFTLPRSART